jgi:arylsulfatase A-like enzyme/tetratricopeptide (TPR) repeat protein
VLRFGVDISAPRPGTARTIVCLAAVVAMLAVVAPGSNPAGQAPPSRRPNILLVTIDTLRADRIGAYGAKSPATPVMDRLAADGCLFEEMVVQVPLTRASHATILTGLYPFQHGIRDNFAPPLGAAHRTLAEILKGQQYVTGGFVGSFILNTQSGLNRGFDEFDDTFETGGKGSAFFTEYQRRAAQVEERAGPWIERVATRAQPFFAWVHFYDPHSPYAPPPPYRTRYAKNPYDGEVAYTDEIIGRLLARLAKLGVADRTLVVVTADHGESLGEHKEEEHGFFVYEAALRVPLILRMPGRIGKGVRTKTDARSIDLVPTILDLAGLRTATPQGLPGHSLLAAMASPQKADPAIISYSETLFPRLHFGWSELRSVRMGGWKFIQAPRPELYDLTRDPGERHNLFAGEGRRVAAMRSRLLDTLGGSLETAVVGVAKPALDRETMDRLASLGYVSGPGAGAASNADPKDKIEEFMAYGGAIRTALAAFDGGNLKAAVKGLEAIVSAGRGGFDVSYYLGRAYLQLRDFRAAIPHLRDAILKVPTYTPAYLELAKAFVALKQYDEAMRVLGDGLARDPRNFQFHSHLGFVARAKQDLPTARRHYEAARSLEPGDFDVRMNLAAIYRDMGEPRLALQEVDAALKIQPDASEAHNQRGMLLGGLGNLAAAAGAFERAATLDPKNALMWFNLGLTRLRSGDNAGAAAALRRALDLRPDFTDAKKLLAETGR